MAAARLVLSAARLFDGIAMHADRGVLLDGERIVAVGPPAELDAADARVVDCGDATLLPGLIEMHSHVLLHPYDVRAWADQVLSDAQALRVARAVPALKATLDAGFTVVRDLGTEGAGYADAGLRDAIAQGIIPGPEMIVTTRAIVATGSYGPKGFAPECCVPIGAEEADGFDALTRVVRDQIRRGADWIKIYADYGWGPGGQARPTFTLDELRLVVEIAESSGRHVCAHASTAEGMRRATLAGVRTIEHGDEGTPEVFALMVERGVALVPTLAATDGISRQRGWNGADPPPPRVAHHRAAFSAALASGVTIANGSDVGVFAHGDNARELELLVRYGMSPTAALAAATSVAAAVLERADIGRVQPGSRADILVTGGDPSRDISALRDVRMVVQRGRIVREPSP